MTTPTMIEANIIAVDPIHLAVEDAALSRAK